jgi:hypothetical protein
MVNHVTKADLMTDIETHLHGGQGFALATLNLGVQSRHLVDRIKDETIWL